MRKTFVMRGQTGIGSQEVLNFGTYKKGYAYRLAEFILYPRIAIGQSQIELSASVTAAKTFEDPQNPNFNNDGLIATAFLTNHDASAYPSSGIISVVNDTYIITQNLILAVIDTVAGAPTPVNWQCRFESVKMTGSEEAAVNYKQFAISDE